jgi:hypothetical protein
MFPITLGRVASLIAVAIAGAVLSACGDTTPIAKRSNPVGDARDTFLGEFAYQPGGQPAIRITKGGGAYFVSTLDRGVEWTTPLPLATATQEHFSRVFGKGWRACVDSGLVNERGFGLFKVRQGCTANNVTFRTGYYFLLGFAYSDAYKL